MNIALRSEDWQLFLAASTIQQCESGSDFNDSTFAKHSHEPEPALLVCSTIQRFNALTWRSPTGNASGFRFIHVSVRST
jgi:hypothetical protein